MSTNFTNPESNKNNSNSNTNTNISKRMTFFQQSSPSTNPFLNMIKLKATQINPGPKTEAKSSFNFVSGTGRVSLMSKSINQNIATQNASNARKEVLKVRKTVINNGKKNNVENSGGSKVIKDSEEKSDKGNKTFNCPINQNKYITKTTEEEMNSLQMIEEEMHNMPSEKCESKIPVVFLKDKNKRNFTNKNSNKINDFTVIDLDKNREFRHKVVINKNKEKSFVDYYKTEGNLHSKNSSISGKENNKDNNNKVFNKRLLPRHTINNTDNNIFDNILNNSNTKNNDKNNKNNNNKVKINEAINKINIENTSINNSSKSNNKTYINSNSNFNYNNTCNSGENKNTTITDDSCNLTNKNNGEKSKTKSQSSVNTVNISLEQPKHQNFQVLLNMFSNNNNKPLPPKCDHTFNSKTTIKGNNAVINLTSNQGGEENPFKKMIKNNEISSNNNNNNGYNNSEKSNNSNNFIGNNSNYKTNNISEYIENKSNTHKYTKQPNDMYKSLTSPEINKLKSINNKSAFVYIEKDVKPPLPPETLKHYKVDTNINQQNIELFSKPKINSNNNILSDEDMEILDEIYKYEKILLDYNIMDFTLTYEMCQILLQLNSEEKYEKTLKKLYESIKEKAEVYANSQLFYDFFILKNYVILFMIITLNLKKDKRFINAVFNGKKCFFYSVLDLFSNIRESKRDILFGILNNLFLEEYKSIYFRPPPEKDDCLEKLFIREQTKFSLIYVGVPNKYEKKICRKMFETLRNFDLSYDNFFTYHKKISEEEKPAYKLQIAQSVIRVVFSEEKVMYLTEEEVKNYEFDVLKKIIDKDMVETKRRFGDEVKTLFRKEDLFDDIIKYIFFIFGNKLMIEAFVKPLNSLITRAGVTELEERVPNVTINLTKNPRGSARIESTTKNDLNNGLEIDLEQFDFFLNEMITKLKENTPFVLKFLMKLVYISVKEHFTIDEGNYNPLYTLLIFNFIISPRVQMIYKINPLRSTFIRNLNRLIRNTCYNFKFNDKDSLSIYNTAIENNNKKLRKFIEENVLSLNETEQEIKDALKSIFSEKYLSYPKFLFYSDSQLLMASIDGGVENIIDFEEVNWS